MMKGIALLLSLVCGVEAFVTHRHHRALSSANKLFQKVDHVHAETTTGSVLSRRDSLAQMVVTAAAAVGVASPNVVLAAAPAEEPDPMYARQFLQQYDDFTQTPSGMSFRTVTPGQGVEAAQVGDRVVYDWSGYTIGYFGRPFQAKGGPQGGAFDKDLDFARTVIGAGQVVKGLEEALIGMKAGEVKQVIVPYGNLSYPQATDPTHDTVGPKPTSFSGQRALNFVLDNPRVDRTLLFNVKVIRVDKPNGKGGFTRG